MHQFQWLAVRPHTLFNKNPDKLEIPFAFVVPATQPKPIGITFNDSLAQLELKETTQKFSSSWNQFRSDNYSDASETIHKDVGVDRDEEVEHVLRNWYSEQGAFTQFYTSLQRPCYWTRGDYQLEVKILSSKTETTAASYSFTLTEEDCESLRLNAIQLLRQGMGDFAGAVNFCYAELRSKFEIARGNGS